MKLIYIGFLTIVLLVSCKKETLPSGERGSLIESTYVTTISKTEIPSYVTEFDANSISLYDVECYKIIYQTIFNNKSTRASGLLLLPKGTDSTHLLLYCHGTNPPAKLLGSTKNTPSYFAGSKTDFFEIRNTVIPFSTQGYAVFVPDYIGFGASSDKEHPYVLFEEQYQSNIDGMLAAKKAVEQLGKLFDSRLFIAGWSQGAGCAISAHKFTQEMYANDFNVVASSGYAGPYDFEKFAEYILQSPNQPIDVMPLFCWYAYAMNRYQGLNRATDQIFSYPVYDQMSALLTNSMRPTDNLQDFFLAGVKNKTDLEVISRLHANSFNKGWTPQGHVYLYHGEEDKMIPFITSVSAFEGLTAAGGNVELFLYPNGDHYNVLSDFVTITISKFNELR